LIRAIVFDLDGVLVDAAPWHYESFVKALRVFGYDLSPEEHDKRFNGLPTAEKLRLLSSQTAFPKKLHRLVNSLKQKFTDELFSEKCRPSPPIRQLLENLKSRGYKLAVASNSRRATVDMVLAKMEITSFFDVILSHEQVLRPKPAPDIYLTAFAELAVNPMQVLIVEDAPAGIQAARASGATVLQVSSPDQVTIKNIDTFLSSLESREEATKAPLRHGLQILIPMAGEGSRFQQAGYTDAKPFIPVQGKPMIEWVVNNLRPAFGEYRFIFLCQQKHLGADGRNPVLDQVAPNSAQVPVPGLTQGAACTALLAADELDDNLPLLLANSDQYVTANLEAFLQFSRDTECDGAILTFPASDTKWSYAETDESGRVIRVAEKQKISPHATVGIYYFKRAGDFLTAAKKMISLDVRTNGEFYACPVYNQLIAEGKDIRIFSIGANQMHGLGTPEDLTVFLRFASVLN
jgi:HAD superfamily hydrolase (TIGR01509 family)